MQAYTKTIKYVQVKGTNTGTHTNKPSNSNHLKENTVSMDKTIIQELIIMPIHAIHFK